MGNSPSCPDNACMSEYIDIMKPKTIAKELRKIYRRDMCDHPQYGWSPLTTAARYNLIQVGREILQHEGWILMYATDSSGHTAFQMAEERGHKKFIKMLEEMRPKSKLF